MTPPRTWAPENVSRETLETLHDFEDLVQKWSAKINLVSSRDRKDIWQRHIIDSAQVWCIAQGEGHWIDIGSGGGFPALVAAILAKDTVIRTNFTLVESDQRKCTFLRQAARMFDLNATVICDRIENVTLGDATTLSARALASLSRLLDLSQTLATEQTTFLFPKGKSWPEEIEQAAENWQFSYTAHPSQTNPESAILELTHVRKR
jgi:16S rRNA (guanine527-N7)-methyltransferase